MIWGVIHVWVWDQIIRALFTQMVAVAPQKVSRQTWCSSHALHLCFQRWRGRCLCVRAERSWSSEECWRRSLRKVAISSYFRSLPNDLILEIKVDFRKLFVLRQTPGSREWCRTAGWRTGCHQGQTVTGHQSSQTDRGPVSVSSTLLLFPDRFLKTFIAYHWIQYHKTDIWCWYCKNGSCKSQHRVTEGHQLSPAVRVTCWFGFRCCVFLPHYVKMIKAHKSAEIAWKGCFS